MKISSSIVITGLLCLCCAAVDLVPGSLFHTGFITDAKAVIGRPLTPMSYAGVARRSVYGGAGYMPAAAIATTAVVAGAASAEIASQNAQIQAQQEVIATQQAAMSSALPVGATVTQLPAGCTSTTINNVAYSACGGVYYRAAFQGNNLVYVVQTP